MRIPGGLFARITPEVAYGRRPSERRTPLYGSRSSMADPTVSDIYFKNRMAWVWTTLKILPTYDMNLVQTLNKGANSDSLTISCHD